VTDSQSAQNSASVSITVSSAPNILSASASASPTSGQPPLTVNFTGGASGGVAPYSYSWNFGDGASSAAQNPSHTYTTIGNFTATLTVTDTNKTTATASVVITVSAVSAYNLSIGAETGAPAPGQGGTTSPSPGIHSFPVGTTAEVRSIPNSNYRFSKWAGDIPETSLFSEQATITMDRNKSVTATFCTMCGDINGDLKITPADAQAAFDIFLGRLPNPTWCEKENADVNSSGTKLEPKVTPADAQAIFNKYLKRGELPGDCSGSSRSEAGSAQIFKPISSNLVIEIIAQESAGEILVPIIVEPVTDINAFGIDVAFQENKLAYIGFEKTDLTTDFEQLDTNILSSQEHPHEFSSPISSTNAAHGQNLISRSLFIQGTANASTGHKRPLNHIVNKSIVRVGGYKITKKAMRTSGVLITLIFRIITKTTEEIPISISATYDDIQSAIVRYEIFSSNETRKENKAMKTEDRTFIGKRYNF